MCIESQVPLSMSDPVILSHGIQPSHYAIRGTGVMTHADSDARRTTLPAC
jgi:hypothetical protein